MKFLKSKSIITSLILGVILFAVSYFITSSASAISYNSPHGCSNPLSCGAGDVRTVSLRHGWPEPYIIRNNNSLAEVAPPYGNLAATNQIKYYNAGLDLLIFFIISGSITAIKIYFSKAKEK